MTLRLGLPESSREVPPQWWLRIAGVGTWLVAGLPAMADALAGLFRGPGFLAWLVAFVGFGVSFVLSMCVPRRTGLRHTVLLIVQTICALTMTATTGDGFSAATLVVIAGQLLWVLPLGAALLWVAVQSAVLLAIFGTNYDAVAAISAAGAYCGFQLFAVAAAALAIRERRAAEALARVNAELSATRDLLAENSRVAERLRISRDLHDTLGHHLTALSLQLDVASRLSTGQATEHISQAHAIARLLLSDVRDVVSRLRESGHVDVAPLLRELAARSSQPSVHLDLPPDLAFDDLGQGHAMLRAVQEIITNAAKHSGAGHLWIRIAREPDRLVLEAYDDGRGGDVRALGNGLTGMRERFEEYRGGIDIATQPGKGFSVRGFLPVVEPRA